MRKTKGVLIFLLLIVMILVTINSAMAARGKESGTTNPIDLVADKSAKGMTFNGNLAIYYYPIPNSYRMNMLVMMRLRKSSTWYPFAGIMANVDYNDLGENANAMQAFLDNHVVPKLRSWGVVGPNAVAKYRTYSNIVEDDELNWEGCCGYNVANGFILFVIMDIEVAIRD